MTIDRIKKISQLFINGNITGEEFGAIFNLFWGMYYKKSNVSAEETNLLEQINEDVSRYEPNEKLRNEESSYYFSEDQLRESVKRLIE